MFKNENDIKAPDGFLLGGLRQVRKDGTLLFLRTYWKCPDEWIGQRVWVHVIDPLGASIEAAPPGIHIYYAREETAPIKLEPADRPGAKPGYRKSAHKAWANRP